MTTGLTPTTERFLYNLNDIAQRMQTAQTELSSGRKINLVSDAPDEIAPLLQARASLASAQQIQTNLGQIKLETDSGEQALESAQTLMDRVTTLGAEATSPTATSDGQAAIAQELGGILQNFVGLANTNVNGRYIFAGDKDGVAPYSIDLTQANPVSAYAGSASTRVAQDPNGTTFPVSQTAQDIFDSSAAGSNVFQAIQGLRSAVTSGDATAIQSAVAALQPAASHLAQSLAYYGTVQDAVQSATNEGQNLQVQIQSQISNLEDADMTDAILQLNQGQTQQQAALQAYGQIPRTTLFDFLKG